MTDREKMEKLVAFIKDAEEHYADLLVKGYDTATFGGKLAALYDIELFMENDLDIPMGIFKEEEDYDYE